ncbi:snoRNA-binding rRNA-processing protein imp4 [Dimargaris cristalligena]|uniref:U3 small nucleolar ribonucleoprotein protein IMP4 n=1 Tax=Dimargaris cristalligena TaxID=215637 RepID=A0A4P9ZSY6_9FUNG|nr:snoRNA-binding rRNA-processing protein imp4 [Dimargaris cristalligena]RKP36684.1 anticodon-binding protein [Dimargaris cristalligena]|eukprot:RKP36684.1 anticodon-binding protein [Dimargaris cristalligena]
MIRRQTRLRREYLYRKALEARERNTFEKKQKIKNAIEENRAIPQKLQGAAVKLVGKLKYDEAQNNRPANHRDDEYAHAGVFDPKILITTSRDPSSRLKQFSKEMRHVFPNSQKINRGGLVINEIVDTCRSNGVTDLVILGESRGQPDSMIISHLPYGPTVRFTLYNVVLRHDIPNLGAMSEAYPHLIFGNLGSNVGRRVKDVLKYLFPVPKTDSKRVMTFHNDNDFISFRHHVYQPVTDKEVVLSEVGPRFEMRPFEIRLGTIEMKEADTEWVLRPFMRTAHKHGNL